jgi:vitamin B12/bleomycin/antimicrobial peptide transport system ATP-binding/permease protein
VIGSRSQGEGNPGTFRLVERDVVIAEGEHVMVNGDQGVNRKLLFNALAGLWPFGKGRILFPAGTDILFVPQIGYLPEGRLRSLLAYPVASANFTDADLQYALSRVGLTHLSTRLDERARWERLLDKDEQMALAFANILLRKPGCVVLFDVLEGLEPETEARLAGLLGEMTGTTLLYIGRSAAFAAATGARLVHLERGGGATP